MTAGPVGHRTSHRPHSSGNTRKDVILYALSVGAGFDELEVHLGEEPQGHPHISVATIFDFFWAVQKSNSTRRGPARRTGDPLPQPHPRLGDTHHQRIHTNRYRQGKKGAVIRGQSVTLHSGGAKLYTTQ